VKLNNLRIVIDDREKKSGIPDLLKAVGVNIEIKTLPIGDYICHQFLMEDFLINVQD